MKAIASRSIGGAFVLLVLLFFVSGHQQSLDELDATARRLGLDVVLEWKYPRVVEGGVIAGQNPEPAEVAPFAVLFAREVDRYPREFIQRVGMRVVFGEKLFFNGQSRVGMTDYVNNTVYFDAVVATENCAKNDLYVRRLIHHELMHGADYAKDRQIQFDTNWEALNSAPFKYLGGGDHELMRNGQVSQLKEMPNFLNTYSKSSVAEDKAEIFSYLMTNDAVALSRLYNDPVLKKKMDLLKSELIAFCPAIDDNFWRLVRMRVL